MLTNPTSLYTTAPNMTTENRPAHSVQFCQDCKMSAPLRVFSFAHHRFHVCPVCSPPSSDGIISITDLGVFVECNGCRAIVRFKTARRCTECYRLTCEPCFSRYTVLETDPICSLQCGRNRSHRVTALAIPPSPLRE